MVVTARRGRPRKTGQNPVPQPAAPPPVESLPLAPLEVRRALAVRLLPLMAKSLALLNEAVDQGRSDMAAGRPLSRNAVEAAKTALAMGGMGARQAAPETEKDLASRSTAELQAIVDQGLAQIAARGNAAKDVTPEAQPSDMFS